MKYLKYLGIYPNWIFTLIYKYPWVFYITNHSTRSVLRLKLIKFQFDIKKKLFFVDWQICGAKLKKLFSIWAVIFKVKIFWFGSFRTAQGPVKVIFKRHISFHRFCPSLPSPGGKFTGNELNATTRQWRQHSMR